MENLVAVVKFVIYLGVMAGGCGLFATLAMRWWEKDEAHRKRMAPLKARVLRRQREAAKEKTSK